MSSPITTHILDTSTGRPAAGVPVTLDVADGGGWRPLGSGVTDADGRNRALLAAGALTAGVYRISFDTGSYFEASGTRGFYPHVRIIFEVDAPAEHYHVPLLLNPYGYSTYRGS